MTEKEKKTIYDKLVDWFDVRFGLAKTPLKPIPIRRIHHHQIPNPFLRVVGVFFGIAMPGVIE